MENKNEAVIANYIEKMMGERRQKIFDPGIDVSEKKHLDVRFTVEIIRSVRNRIFVVGLCTVVPAVVLDYFPILRTLLRKTE